MPWPGIAPAPRRITARSSLIAPQGPAPVSSAFPVGEHFRLLETRIQVIRLSPYHADLPARRPCTWARPPVFCHAVFPYCPFELRLGIRSRDKLLPSLPAARAIQQRASWRTDDVLESCLYLLRDKLTGKAGES